ncbi:MAG: TFIIB-type zinc ribbon-containing protein, partial [Nitrosopumilaceae archaeon]
MAFSDIDTTCPSCGIGRLIDDPTNEEHICTRCGFASRLTEQISTCIENKGSSRNLRPYRLGSDRRSIFSEKDYAGKTISSQVKWDLITASKYDREQVERERAAVSHITELYEKMIYPQYDDGLKKGDLEILKQRAKNMIVATGERQSELDLMKIIRRFLRVKLGKNPDLKKYFKLDLLHIKIRYQRERPKNIAGRGNQLGKRRKEGRIEYCNICKAEIPNYKVRKHHAEHHGSIPYHKYIDRKNHHVRR